MKRLIVSVTLLMGLSCFQSAFAIESYLVKIDYDQSIREMIEAGKYTWEDPYIQSASTPIIRHGIEEVEIYLIQFNKGRYNKTISTRRVLKKLNKMGFRPATLPELLALGTQYPNSQMGRPIFALGSVFERRKQIQATVAVILGLRKEEWQYFTADKRCLGRSPFKAKWRSGEWFAVVRK